MRIAASFIALVFGVTGCLQTPGVSVAQSGAGGSTSAGPEPVTLTVPDANWRLAIDRIYERDDAVWILARVWREPGVAAQMITTLRCEIPVALPAKPRRVFIAGKTWGWKNDEPVEFVASLEAVEKNAGNARVLFPTP